MLEFPHEITSGLRLQFWGVLQVPAGAPPPPNHCQYYSNVTGKYVILPMSAYHSCERREGLHLAEVASVVFRIPRHTSGWDELAPRDR